MFTLKVLGFLLVVITLTLIAVKWERRKNLKQGKPNLEHAPMIIGYSVHCVFAEARYKRAKAKYDVLKAMYQDKEDNNE